MSRYTLHNTQYTLPLHSVICSFSCVLLGWLWLTLESQKLHMNVYLVDSFISATYAIILYR